MCREAHEGVVLGSPEMQRGPGAVPELGRLDVTSQVEIHLAKGGTRGIELYIDRVGFQDDAQKEYEAQHCHWKLALYSLPESDTSTLKPGTCDWRMERTSLKYNREAPEDGGLCRYTRLKERMVMDAI